MLELKHYVVFNHQRQGLPTDIEAGWGCSGSWELGLGKEHVLEEFLCQFNVSYYNLLSLPQAPGYAVLSRSLFSGECTAQAIKHYLQDAKLDTNPQSELVPVEPGTSMPVPSHGNS